jgi:glutamate/tyrosine decarboxylase-like PLP-dependent enzyme
VLAIVIKSNIMPSMKYFNKFSRDREGPMRAITKPIASHLLVRLIPYLNRVNQYRASRDQMAEDMQIPKRNLSNALRDLYSADVVRKVDKATYMVNPEVTYAGDDRQEAVITYLWDGLPSKVPMETLDDV